MHKRFLVTGSILALLAVILGAFGAHALEALLREHNRYDTYQTGIQYHMFHSVAILITGIAMQKKSHRLLRISGILFLVGILCFSGSLYVMSLTGQTWMGIITPIGGLFFISGWLVLTYYFVKLN